MMMAIAIRATTDSLQLLNQCDYELFVALQQSGFTFFKNEKLQNITYQPSNTARLTLTNRRN